MQNRELWGKKCCVDRQDVELRACRQRIGELQVGIPVFVLRSEPTAGGRSAK